jgi:MSHA pilin protein MshD
MCINPLRLRQRGVSLIELIIFIVVIGTALVGILAVMNQATAHSADPLIRKQALAIAESLLEEVELMPFTFCDPDDVNAASATSATVGGAGCAVAGGVENLGPEPAFGSQTTAETRYSTTTPFDNVNDYNGCQMNTGVANACDSSGTVGIQDITGTVNPALSAYNVSVVVAAATCGGVASAGDALQITVTVNGPGGTQVVLDGCRARFSPRI